MNFKYFWDDPIENGGLIRGNDFNAQYCFNQSFGFQMIKNLLENAFSRTKVFK